MILFDVIDIWLIWLTFNGLSRNVCGIPPFFAIRQWENMIITYHNAFSPNVEEPKPTFDCSEHHWRCHSHNSMASKHILVTNIIYCGILGAQHTSFHGSESYISRWKTDSIHWHSMSELCEEVKKVVAILESYHLLHNQWWNNASTATILGKERQRLAMPQVTGTDWKILKGHLMT